MNDVPQHDDKRETRGALSYNPREAVAGGRVVFHHYNSRQFLCGRCERKHEWKLGGKNHTRIPCPCGRLHVRKIRGF